MQNTDPVSLTYGQLTDLVERIEEIPTLSGAGAPTASTPAFYKGQIYLDTTTNELYHCTFLSNSGQAQNYTWVKTGKTYNPFTGATSSAAGTAGLVPAPASGATDKYLKSDGTWATIPTSPTYTAGDGIDITNAVISATNTGKARVLTTADYNYPVDNPSYVALWLLEPGVYAADNMSVSINVRTHINSSDYHSGVFIVGGRQDTFQPSTLYQVPIIVRSAGTTKFVAAYGSGSFASILDLDDCLLKSSVVQTTGSSTSWVMSQKAVTSMAFADPSTQYRVQIGASANATSNNGVAIGRGATSSSNNGAVALGPSAYAIGQNSVAIGAGANASAQGQFDIGTSHGAPTGGYNGTAYRLLSGLYDPQSAHDAATKGYVDNSLPASFDTNEWNALWA